MLKKVHKHTIIELQYNCEKWCKIKENQHFQGVLDI